MKSTIANNRPIADRDSNPAAAGHARRHARGHAPWLRAIPVIVSRFVLASTRAVGTCRLFLFSVLLETVRCDAVLYRRDAAQ